MLALAVIAPLLTDDLFEAAEVAELNATAVIIDGEISATTKILALDIRDTIDRVPEEIPDFTAVFEEHGSLTDVGPRRPGRASSRRSSRRSPAASGRRSSSARSAALAVIPVAAFRRRLA